MLNPKRELMPEPEAGDRKQCESCGGDHDVGDGGALADLLGVYSPMTMNGAQKKGLVEPLVNTV